MNVHGKRAVAIPGVRRGSLPPFLRFSPRPRLRFRVYYLFALKCLRSGACGEPYGEPLGKPPNARFSRDFRIPTKRISHEIAERWENRGLQDEHTPTLIYSQKVDATPQRKTAHLCEDLFFFLVRRRVCAKSGGCWFSYT